MRRGGVGRRRMGRFTSLSSVESVMKRTQQFVMVLSILALAVTVGTSQAQQRGKGGQRGFGGGMFAGGNSVVLISANEAVQKDIGASGDVASKLTSLRDDMNAARQKEYQSAGINPQDFQNMTNEQRQKMGEIATKLNDEFNPKVKS